MATLTFQLPDEQGEHADALRGPEFRSALWDIDQRLRSALKHDDSLDERTKALLKEVRGNDPRCLIVEHAARRAKSNQGPPSQASKVKVRPCHSGGLAGTPTEGLPAHQVPQCCLSYQERELLPAW